MWYGEKDGSSNVRAMVPVVVLLFLQVPPPSLEVVQPIDLPSFKESYVWNGAQIGAVLSPWLLLRQGLLGCTDVLSASVSD